ncbi:YihY/virulence factor BrkB family protein [Acidocella aminolytica]|uniref:T-RNA-processing ribonuclease BN n=1 Tax=Acidocella aminolytica 101 = DSM 11237 TaxID=1120923 RepID=A0A0D6PHQ6_9PROT|nr:YihY/virulence factor BrkB family protein [Acidocella aminolytica]GAN80733.1 t-RNA-processing ribonuclease BN [Acidocella aminolytica 101 = DSM 11237]
MPRVKSAAIFAARATASQRVSLVAAGCAFYATLALFPTITMLISLYGLVFDPDTVQPQLAYLQGFMPPDVYMLISQRIQNLVAQPAKGLGLSFAVSLLLSLWSSSTGTKSVINALTLAYHERETRGLIRFHLVALSMTFIAVLGTILAIGFLVFLPIAMAYIGLPGNLEFLVGLISFGAMISFVIVALGLLYRFGPAGQDRMFYAPGATIATVAWLAASWAFGLYVGRFAAYSATYGPLATIIGLMMWFYISAYVVLFGAEFNAALDRQWRGLQELDPQQT